MVQLCLLYLLVTNMLFKNQLYKRIRIMALPFVRSLWFLVVSVSAPFFFGDNADASLYLTGSVSSSISNVRFQTYESRYGSSSLGIDLGRYIRLQYTYSQEYSYSYGYKDQSSTGSTQTKEPVDSYCTQCVETRSMTRVIGNSVDLQIVLYEGTVFVPYAMLGAIVKTYEMRVIENGIESGQAPVPMGPLPNLGAGVGIRLNKDFTLKVSYITSPGVSQERGEEPRSTWDKKLTVGITYQI